MSFAGIVYALPRCIAGTAVLELHNDTDSALIVKGVLAGSGNGSMKSLLPDEVPLEADQKMRVDVTDGLKALFDVGANTEQAKTFEIMLHLGLKPQRQPSPAKYRALFSKGQFLQFSGN